jgi:hypothetical protein
LERADGEDFVDHGDIVAVGKENHSPQIRADLHG